MEGTTHKQINEKAKEILARSSIYIENKLGYIMEQRGLNQTELAHLTGIRQATINEIVHDRKYSINKHHTMVLMLALKLTDINELYEVQFRNPEELERLKEEKQYVEYNGLTPAQDMELSVIRKKKGLK